MWGSKKQRWVAFSSTKYEYIALAKATTNALWLRKLLQELGFPQINPTTISLDSQSAIALTHDPKFHSRSKHIDTQQHYTREQILLQKIELHYISTNQMATNVFTKSLNKAKHYECIKNLRMSSTPSQYQQANIV